MMVRRKENANCKLADVPSGITNDRSTASTLNMPLSRANWSMEVWRLDSR